MELSEEQKRRANARSYLNVYIRRGLVLKLYRCERCGAEGETHGHHHDYGKPLDVEWLCPDCHKAIHAAAS